MFGVYRVLKNGTLRYLSRSATQSEALAKDIAASMSRGEITRPDGSVARVPAYPHIARPIGDTK